MGALTENSPKPLLEVGGKTLLEQKFDALPKEVDEIILIVGYMGSKVHEKFGGNYNGKKILYIEQENPTGGTAEALWLAKDILHDTFLVMNGDNIYSPEDIARCASVHGWAVLVQEKERVGTGRVVVDAHGRVMDIVENSDHAGEKGYANTALYVLDTRIFQYKPVPKAPESTELGLPQTMMQAARDIHIHTITATFWIEIKSPTDLARAEAVLAAL